MQFCIRDDDTSFFTSPEELEHAYGEITRQGPVSLAIVPFHRAGTSKAVPEQFRGRWSTHPLHENSALVDYLRTRIAEGRFEAMLHGYHHDVRQGPHEFAAHRDLRQRVLDGRKYLEGLLKTEIRVFVPPHNALSSHGLRAIAGAGLHVAGVAGIRHGWPVWSLTTWRLWFHLRRWRRQGGKGVPWVLDLGTHREIAVNPVTPKTSLQDNNAAFDSALQVNGVFCAATHYWELATPSTIAGDGTVCDNLRHLLHRARTDSRVQWCSVGEVAASEAHVL